MLIIDAHLDLPWNALQWNRDLLTSAYTIRTQENRTPGEGRGQGTVALPEMRQGRVALCMATLLARFVEAEDFKNPLLVNSRQQQLIRAMETETHNVEAPLQRIEHNLYPYSVFLIMPIFAFVNSGVAFESGNLAADLVSPVTLGVFLGLVLGKQTGVMLFSWLAVRSGLAMLPANVRWLQLYGVSWIAGIGFTMALFVDELAFATEGGRVSAQFLNQGKLGIFLASVTAGTIGYLVLRRVSRA